MGFKASDKTRREAYERQQAEKLASRERRLSRLRQKAEEDPEGIWAELLEEAENES